MSVLIKQNHFSFAKNITLIFALLCVKTNTVTAQQYYPTNYFQSPMDTPLYLSAPFGSLRENHFHSGMDIRTYEKEGLPIYAVADGFVSRIKVSPIGYGKAIYIDHSNGYTSVYGHLQKYEGEIATYIKKYQYEKESFDFDHFPGKALPVKKGQIIGWSGNSGGSTGPHLHFEIRNTKSEEPLNPQLFGIKGVDQYPPFIKKIISYSLNDNRPFVLNDITINAKKLIQRDSLWYYRDTLEIAKGIVGFGIEAYDYLTNTSSEYSLYGMDLYIDDQQYFGYRLDRIDFENSRCINAHIDYEIYKRDKVRFQKCFIDDGNKIKIYNFIRNKGKYSLIDDNLHKVTISVCDIDGRTASLSFYIKGFTDDILKKQNISSCKSATFYPKKDNLFKAKDLILEIPAKALYDTLDFCYELKGKEKNTLSSTHKIHDQYTPLHKSFTLSIKPEIYPDKLQDKLLLAYYVTDGNIRSAGGEFNNGYVTTRSTNFGNYFVSIDTIAPTIKPLNISKDGSINDTISIQFKIEDNLSGISTYKGTINGKWVLMEYDAKNDLLLYEFDENTPRDNKFSFVLTITDKKNNVTTFNKELNIRPR
jgi:hypothetical protein